MGMEERETADENQEEPTVDLSKQALKKIERANDEQKQAIVLLLNDNEIQRLDNLDSYTDLRKLFAANNQLIRMYGVSQLSYLEVLDLSNNSLVTIEGLKELKFLRELHLGRNKIKVIEHLNNNLELEKLDISENNIAHLSDISHLINLKEFHIHGNKLTHLRHCEKHLPENIEILTLHNNSICDLNEISHLTQFNYIKELTFSNNPCVRLTEEHKFNYRPFIKNWCIGLTVLDNCPLDDIECLKAEWLYSQGRGRSFRPGEQAALVEYLATVCPAAEPNADAEDMRKLKLILSKAQQHQKQLKEQLSTGNLTFQEANKVTRRKKVSGLPDRMVTSYHDSSHRDQTRSPDLMTRSLDLRTMRASRSPKSNKSELNHSPLQTSTTFIPIPDTLISPDVCQTVPPFVSPHRRPSSLSSRASNQSYQSKNSSHSIPESRRKQGSGPGVGRRQPTETTARKPESLTSSRSSTPLVKANASPLTAGRDNSRKERSKACGGWSEGEDVETASGKQPQWRGTPKKGSKRLSGEGEAVCGIAGNDPGKTWNEKESREWKAAVCIQSRWRGYRARNLNGEVLDACKDIQMTRMQEYIMKVMSEVEATRVTLEGNRKLQILQMQAINALWRKMVAFQSADPVANSNEGKLTLQNLVETCSSLNKQVEGLKTMMKTFQAVRPSSPIATQTEIVAVHTPQGVGNEIFPFSPHSKVGEAPSDSRSPSAGPVDNGSSLSCSEVKEFISSGEPDVTELFSNKNVNAVYSSDQELFVIPNYHGEKEPKYVNAGLTKPLVKLNEIPPDGTDLKNVAGEDKLVGEPETGSVGPLGSESS